MGATLLEPVEGLAGDALYSGGPPGFFSGGSYGNGADQDGLERHPRLPFPSTVRLVERPGVDVGGTR